MLKKPKQMLKAALGGVTATVVDFVVLFLLVELAGVSVVVAAFVAAVVGGCAGFAVAKLWAFEDRSPVARRQVAAFAGVAVSNAVLVAGLLRVLVVTLGLVYPVAKILASIASFVLWSYPAQSRWVFGKGERYAV